MNELQYLQALQMTTILESVSP